jgi:hypothetical protein
VVVVGTGQERGELDLLELLREGVEAGLELLRQLRVRFVLEKLVGCLQIAQGTLEPFVPIDQVLQSGEALGQLLPARRVVPDGRIRRLSFELAQLRALALDVKGTPSRTGSGRAAFGDGRSDRSYPGF